MISLRLSLAVISALTCWTIVHAAGCGERQHQVDGRGCNKCPPGTYMKDYCTEKQQTVCRPCKEGFYSDQYNMFDRCEKCRSCLYECQENKCVKGEKPKKTEIALDAKMINYTYQCELLKEERPNLTSEPSPERRRDGVDYVPVILGIGFVLVSLTLLVFLSYACVKNLKKYRAHNYPKEVLEVSINTSDSRLSKEESGSVLIMQDESKNNSIGPLCLEEVGLQFIQSVD
nr:tumor necrosis factor receptor superfamily member 5-like isoform X2 [Pseudochaenichthys georgianus]